MVNYGAISIKQYVTLWRAPIHARKRASAF